MEYLLANLISGESRCDAIFVIQCNAICVTINFVSMTFFVIRVMRLIDIENKHE